MRVLIMGAGAVGCYFGGLLARGGHEVMFVGRQHHVRAINMHGLVMELQDQRVVVPAHATTSPHELPTFDLVLFCVKSADTEVAGAQMTSVVGSETVVVSLQNGVDNAERLSTVIGRPVFPAVVYLGAEMAGDGVVKHHGSGRLVFGKELCTELDRRSLTLSDIPIAATDDIKAVLWTKLITNCAWNALSAVCGVDFGTILATKNAHALLEDIVVECAAVASALGIFLPSDLFNQVLAIGTSVPRQISSTAQDLNRGKPTEIAYLNGYIARQGERLGIATPVNHALETMMAVCEQRPV